MSCLPFYKIETIFSACPQPERYFQAMGGFVKSTIHDIKHPLKPSGLFTQGPFRADFQAAVASDADPVVILRDAFCFFGQTYGTGRAYFYALAAARA
jgi:hypothetical protein